MFSCSPSCVSVMLWELGSLRRIGNLEVWRREESNKLSSVVQNRIKRLQNPPKSRCAEVSKIFCNIENSNGFAAGLHDMLWCFIAAYYSNRMLVLNTTQWHYFHGEERWEEIFMPLSETCSFPHLLHNNDESESEEVWPGKNGMNRNIRIAWESFTSENHDMS